MHKTHKINLNNKYPIPKPRQMKAFVDDWYSKELLKFFHPITSQKNIPFHPTFVLFFGDFHLCSFFFLICKFFWNLDFTMTRCTNLVKFFDFFFVRAVHIVCCTVVVRDI